MKLTLKKHILPLLASFSLLFASCSDIAGGEDNDEIKDSKENTTQITDADSDMAYLRVSLASSSARTALPVLDEKTEDDGQGNISYVGLDGYKWTLIGSATGTDADGKDLSYSKDWDDFTALKSENIGLKVNPEATDGTEWTFTLTAYKEKTVTGEGENTNITAAAIYEGSQACIVTSGQVTTLAFTLSLKKIDKGVEGEGNISINLTYTPSNVAKVVASLNTEDDDGDLTEVTTVSYPTYNTVAKTSSGSDFEWTGVPNGLYVVKFTFYDSSDNILGYWEEYANVVAGSTSKSSVKVESLDDVYTITYLPSAYMASVMGENTYKRSFTRHSDTFDLPKASDMDSSLLTFGGWFASEDYDYNNVQTQINASANRRNITLHGYFIDSKEAASVTAPTLTYTKGSGTKHVGNIVQAAVSNFSGTLSYQWYTSSTNTPTASSDLTPISDADMAKYKVTASEFNKYLFVGVTPKYKVSAVAGTNNSVAYYKVSAGTEVYSAEQTATTDLIGKSVVTLTGLSAQYAGKVLVNDKPVKSKVVLSGILADEYGNAVISYEGDLESYDSLTSSKKMNVTITAAGYDINTTGNESGIVEVYIPVQSAALTSSAVSLASVPDDLGCDSETTFGSLSSVPGLILLKQRNSTWRYQLTSGDGEPSSSASAWKELPADGVLPEVNDTSTTISEGDILWIRVAESGTAGADGYIYPSEPIAITITSSNITGSSGSGSDTTEKTATLLSGSEINKILTENFPKVTSFSYNTTDTPPSSALTISTSDSGIKVYVWKDGKALYVQASGYDGSTKKLVLPADMSGMFAGMSKLTSIDLSAFTTKSTADNITTFVVTNMSKLFYNCSNLASVTFGSDFETNAVTDMSYMFALTGIESIDLSGLNTSAVINMSSMFAGSSFVTLDLSTFNVNNVTTMASMFNGADVLEELTLPAKTTENSTANVTDMSSMFAGTALEELDVSMLDTSKVTNMASMFANMDYLTYIDVSNFNVTNDVTSMDTMFSGDSELQKIYVASDTNWKTDAADGCTGAKMFDSCTSLVGNSGNSYSSSATSFAYANSATGYFTVK